MPYPTVAEPAAVQVQRWLLEGWEGRLRPREVQPLRSEDADGRDAWFFLLTLPDPEQEQETWNADDLADLRRAVRDKALEVGLSYPWYVVPRPKRDEPVEDARDLPDDTL